MRSAITVSLVAATKGGPFVFADGLADACARAAEIGFDAIEIFPPAGDAPELDALPNLLREHRLAVAAFGTGAGWVLHQLTLTHADADTRRRARDFVRAIIDRAAAFNAPAIIGSMQGRWDATVSRDRALGWLGEALDELGAHAASRGVPLLYEPLNRYETNLFNRLGEAASWLRARGTPNVRLLADLFHMNIDEADMARALREADGLLGHVHFADSNRQAIGFGHLDVEPIITTLREMNYTGLLSAEIFPLPDATTAARQTIAAFRRFVSTPC